MRVCRRAGPWSVTEVDTGRTAVPLYPKSVLTRDGRPGLLRCAEQHGKGVARGV